MKEASLFLLNSTPECCKSFSAAEQVVPEEPGASYILNLGTVGIARRDFAKVLFFFAGCL